MASAGGGLNEEGGTRRFGGPGFDIVEGAEKVIKRYGMLQGGETVLVAVSGGPDSMCLFDVLLRLTERWDLKLEVAHVDHGLSDGSARVAAAVARAAAAEGIDAHVLRASGLEGPNLHARARELRYGFFDKVKTDVEASLVATAHTMDDRVETTLARLIHGGGPRALAGIPPVGEGRIRPLIWTRRSHTRLYCEELTLPFFDDPANADPRFERAWIRSELLGPIESRWGDGAIEAMATSAERAGEDAGALEAIAAGLFRSARRDAGAVLMGREVFDAAPRALRRRLLELAVGRVRDRGAAIDDVLDWLDRVGSSRASFDIPEGGRIEVDASTVKVISGGEDGAIDGN